ncbi:MAG: PAS domain-containing sensor histidine kinase [Deltaproteobacteria bacterium]|nr:PAS domain-containing sensor histidine kinase [Deltaproteobacteria bacterium]
MESMGEEMLDATGDNKDISDSTLCRFIIDSLPVAVVAVSPDLKITSFNPWAEEVTGYSLEEASGRYCGEILQGEMCKTNCPLITVINRQKPVVRVESKITNRYGRTMPIEMNTAGLFDNDGKLIGGLEAFRDTSCLKALEREKANIVSMIAHDMKSSVVIMGGFVLRLLNKGTDIAEEKQRKYLEIIKKEGNELESLINDFLEFSHLQTGKLKLNFSFTSLDGILLDLFNAYRTSSLQRGLRLELKNKDPLPIIEADADRLRRVFSNLLDNALKYSKQKGTITITTQETDQDVIVRVIDEGIGIDSKEIPYIFDSFQRVQDKGKRKGYGLGLAVVKAIVEGHGGRILVESELDKGSVFSVILPKDRNKEIYPLSNLK